MFWTKQNITFCHFNYFMQVTGICQKYNFNKWAKNYQTLLENQDMNKFMCNNGKSFDSSLINDLVTDCGPEAEDEPLLLSLKKTGHMFHCKPQEIPCMEGHSMCFTFLNICLYQLDTKKHLIPCKNGGHLENCKNFECNMMYKFPNNYCIPWAYVCDRKWDCPLGEDESTNTVCGRENVCEKMFKCRNEHRKCIHIGNVCDSQVDCLYNDDELFCELKSVQCLLSCTCLIFAISCVKLSFHSLLSNIFPLYSSVFITKSSIDSFSIFELKLEGISVVKLPGNNIESICPLMFLQYLVFLDLQFNYLVEIKEKCFSVSRLLQSLSLYNNYIIYLDVYSFHDLHYLRSLNLSSNPFVNLPLKSFSNLLSLQVLNLQNMKFRIVELNSFFSTIPKLINTIDYKISCVIPKNSICTSYPPWYVSCSDILPNVSLKIMYFCVSLLTICLNILSSLLQFLKIQINECFRIKVVGLNFSDCLCGIYLIGIWISDILFQGVYLVNQDSWKSHPFYFTGFSIILWFTISSHITILYFSVTRLVAIIYPLTARGI